MCQVRIRGLWTFLPFESFIFKLFALFKLYIRTCYFMSCFYFLFYYLFVSFWLIKVYCGWKMDSFWCKKSDDIHTAGLLDQKASYSSESEVSDVDSEPRMSPRFDSSLNTAQTTREYLHSNVLHLLWKNNLLECIASYSVECMIFQYI